MAESFIAGALLSMCMAVWFGAIQLANIADALEKANDSKD